MKKLLLISLFISGIWTPSHASVENCITPFAWNLNGGGDFSVPETSTFDSYSVADDTQCVTLEISPDRTHLMLAGKRVSSFYDQGDFFITPFSQTGQNCLSNYYTNSFNYIPATDFFFSFSDDCFSTSTVYYLLVSNSNGQTLLGKFIKYDRETELFSELNSPQQMISETLVWNFGIYFFLLVFFFIAFYFKRK